MTESSGLPPEQEAVRRLLADARHDGPTASRRRRPPRRDPRLPGGRAWPSAAEAPPSRDRHDDRSPGRSSTSAPAGAGVAASACWPPPPSSSPAWRIGQGLPPRRQRRRQRLGRRCRQSDSSLAESRPRTTRSSADASGWRRQRRSGAAAADPQERAASCTRSPASRRLSSGTTPTSTTSCSRLRPDATTRSPAASGSLDALRGCEPRRPGQGRRGRRTRSTARPGVVVFRRPDGAAQQASSSTCAATPSRCVRSRCPRPERCGRGVEQRWPTIG